MGIMLKMKRALNDTLVRLLHLERRLDPYFRDTFDRLFRSRISWLVQALINAGRKNEHLAIAEEKLLPGERQAIEEIERLMTNFTHRHYKPGKAERSANTKTYGVVRGEFEVLPNLANHLRQGIFSSPRTYPAWVRFAGMLPLSPPDLEDAGILSMSIKLMGVEGDKLIDDEKMTQDFTALSAPTFTTPNVLELVKLHKQVAEDTPVLYYVNLFDSHIRDAVMQGLYTKTHGSPLEVQFYSSVPYLFGEDQAIHYSIKPSSSERTKVPRRPSDNYLREAMIDTLHAKEVSFDFMVQFQTDSHRMPIENASVEWSERLSPFIPVAKLRLPRQMFASEKQLAFAAHLSFNPWHSIAAHRPLGSLNRGRKAIYLALSKARQTMNGEARVEPTSNEVFDG
jgi:hypothetical protein